MQCTEIRFPTTNDVIYHDTDCMIVWSYNEQDARSMPLAVDIELQRARDGRPVRTIAQRVRNQGSFFWSLGSNVPTGGPFRLFVGNMFMTVAFSDFGGSSTVKSSANAIYSGAFRIQRSRNSNNTSLQHNGVVGIPKSIGSFCNTADSLSEIIASMSIEDDIPVSQNNAEALKMTRMVSTTSEDDEVNHDNNDDSGMCVDDVNVESNMLVSLPQRSSREEKQQQQQIKTNQRKRLVTINSNGRAERQSTTSTRGTSGASAFALDASGSGGGGGYTAASNNALTDNDKELLCAYIYSCVQMPASVIRRNLKEIVGSDDITPSTLLSTDMRAGQFCIYYLLQRYYKKQLMRSNADLERRIDKEDYRVESIEPFLMRVLNVPRAYRGLNAPSGISGNGASVVVCGGSTSPSKRGACRSRINNNGSGSASTDVTATTRTGAARAGGSSGEDDEDEQTQLCLTESGTAGDTNDLSGSQSGTNRKEMSACVEGISIRLEREYLQRIRCWSLNVTEFTLVDTDNLLTAEQFALQYVQTDRRKRIENTRRSKDKRRQREQKQQQSQL